MRTECVLAVQQMASHEFASRPISTHIFSASFASGCVFVSVRAPLSSDGDRRELMHARSEFCLEYDVVSIRK
jgi:hypothetical protein